MHTKSAKVFLTLLSPHSCQELKSKTVAHLKLSCSSSSLPLSPSGSCAIVSSLFTFASLPASLLLLALESKFCALFTSLWGTFLCPWGGEEPLGGEVPAVPKPLEEAEDGSCDKEGLATACDVTSWPVDDSVSVLSG